MIYLNGKNYAEVMDKRYTIHPNEKKIYYMNENLQEA